MSSKPSKPRKFTCTICCSNCRNVGQYEFRRRTVLHTHERYVLSEHRRTTPGENENTIRLDDRYDGTLVRCKFCDCSTALHLRERNGDMPCMPVVPTIAPVVKPAVSNEAES